MSARQLRECCEGSLRRRGGSLCGVGHALLPVQFDFASTHMAGRSACPTKTSAAREVTHCLLRDLLDRRTLLGGILPHEITYIPPIANEGGRTI
jgi:hypothetical protein